MTVTAPDRWRILHTGAQDAYFNMALDELMATACARGVSGPVFRVYEWRVPAITIGYAQRPASFLDIRACEAAGVEVTRRLTGGRALYHVNELAYTVIGRTDDPVFGGSITETYRRINRVITTAFQSCGIAGVTEQQVSEHLIPAAFRRCAPCFASPTKYELARNGLKVAGGAQRRFKDIFLQQGSVRLGPGAQRIADYLLDREASDLYRRVLSGNNTAALETIIATDCFSESFVDAFLQATGQRDAADTLTDEEHRTAEVLGKSRYRSKGWIYGDGPAADL